MLRKATVLILGRMLAAALVLAWLLSPVAGVHAASLFTVANTNDSGPGSLRQAMLDANQPAEPPGALIVFNIPKTDGGFNANLGVWTIRLASPLPALSGGVTMIDGTSQKTNQGDTNPGGPSVEVDGSNVSSVAVFYISSGYNTIRGLAIGGGAAGVEIAGVPSFSPMGNYIRDNLIGTDAGSLLARPNGTGILILAGAASNHVLNNLISGNTLDGIFIGGSGSDNNEIAGNRIGALSGILPNGRHGIFVNDGPSGTLIGSDDSSNLNEIWGNHGHGIYALGARQTRVHGNVIEWNDGEGIALEGGTTGSQITGNFIVNNVEDGLWIAGAGTAFNAVQGNKIEANHLHGVAVYDGAEQNTIGGSGNASNTITGSGWTGVAIVNSSGNTVQNNRIGVAPPYYEVPRGNGYYGVAVIGGNSNTIGPDNVIAYNGLTTGADGVWIDQPGAIKNYIHRNSIYGNGGKGIRLSNGANSSWPAPTISQANCQGLLGNGPPHSWIEIFSDDGDEGRHYEGWTVSSPFLGQISWIGALRGPHVTVVAVDQDTGNTSQFSAPVSGGCHKAFLPEIMR